MTFESWLIFASIALVATVTPGPAILLATTHTASYGLRRALATIFGNISGLFVMSLLSVLGLGTMLIYSTTVFVIVKFVGAAYLIYLGIKLWRNGFALNHSNNATDSIAQSPKALNLYFQGLFVALSNPKAIAFTTALFPQFIVPADPLLAQFALLVLTFMLLSAVCLVAYCYAAENIKSRNTAFSKNPYLSRFFGSAFIVSGVVLASTSQK